MKIQKEKHAIAENNDSDDDDQSHKDEDHQQ